VGGDLSSVTDFPAETLCRLAERVARGEVVFFIGAGFSLDSEGNSAACLIRCLLARFLAMTSILKQAGLRKGLCQTFHLEGNPEGNIEALASEENIQLLTKEYYSINDWISNAFGLLLQAFMKIRPPARRDRVVQEIQNLEMELLRQLEQAAKAYERKGVPLTPLNAVSLPVLEKHRGKALFLDTMGFADRRVMAGEPTAEREEVVASSYGQRLRPRHFVLAWLAREGLCPTLVTTNYDLLIEGAYRLSGSAPDEFPFTRGSTKGSGYFSRIANAEDFFSRGAGHHAALIIKIHGCADRYRSARQASPSYGQEYLPSMVFTYREIQNWRQDDWSRDLLRTLVRTRTLAFAGYSGVDPVLHDTFRTVYEEMAQRRRISAAKGSSRQKIAKEAPAFFFRFADRQEFHAMEILRAASAAAGCRESPLTDHPNFLPFQRSGSKERFFPNLDETMLWLFHLVFRERQAQALREGLRQVAWLFLEHPGARADLEEIEAQFDRLREEERRAATEWSDMAVYRDQFSRIVGWTTRFQAGLLQEWALAEKVSYSQGPGFDLDRLRRSPWYQPASERPEWAACGAILEIALRRAIADWRGKPESWAADSPWVRSGEGEQVPQVLFARGPDTPTPLALTIRLAAFDRVRSPLVRQAYLRSNTTWQLDPADLPWRRSRLSDESRSETPSAEEIWEWASRAGSGSASSFLGVPHG
jgi:hypothetical protein